MVFVWTSYDADAIETSNQKGERGAGVEYRTASGGIPACAAAAQYSRYSAACWPLLCE